MVKVVIFLESGNKIVLSSDQNISDQLVESYKRELSKASVRVFKCGNDTVITKENKIEAIHINGCDNDHDNNASS